MDVGQNNESNEFNSENQIPKPKKPDLDLSQINSSHSLDVQFVRKDITQVNQDIPEDKRLELSALWFANTYTNVKLVDGVWVVPLIAPISFHYPTPPEYADTIYAPCFWPISVDWRWFWNNQLRLVWPPPYPPLTLPGYYEPKKVLSVDEENMFISTDYIPNNYLGYPDPCVEIRRSYKDKILRKRKLEEMKLARLDDEKFEELSSVGFNPEDSTIEAIFKINNTIGYFDRLCTKGGVEQVGFWIKPSKIQKQKYDNQPIVPNIFIGTTSINVYNIDRDYNDNNDSLYYSVRIKLTPETLQYIVKCSDNTTRGLKLATVHCVLAYWKDYWEKEYTKEPRRITNTNLNGLNLDTDRYSVMEADIQFPKSSFEEGKVSFGKNVLRERKVDVKKRFQDSYLEDKEPRSFPVHTVMLKNGKVLMFGGSSNIYYDPKIRTELDVINKVISKSVMLYDPINDTLMQAPPPPVQTNRKDKPFNGNDFANAYYVDIFCSGHSIMPDGSVLVVGGTQNYVKKENDPNAPIDHHAHYPGLWNVCIYYPDTNSWATSEEYNMLNGRWYPSTLVLGDGNIAIMAGHPNDKDLTQIKFINKTFVTRHENIDLEIFDTINYKWKQQLLNGMASINYSAASSEVPGYYPRLFLMPNGLVFSATYLNHTPLNNTNPEIRDGGGFSYNYLWNPNFNTWIKLPFSRDPCGGNDEIAFSALLLPIFPFTLMEDVAVMSFPQYGNCYIINPLSKEPKWKLKNRGFSGTERLYANSVLLPDGNIMYIGGVERPSSSEKGLQTVEFYDTETENWSKGQDLYKVRNYHSNAILLPDGRVLINGSNPHQWVGYPLNYLESKSDDNLLKPDIQLDMEFNHELSFELYSPDYLYRGPRPEFTIDRDVIIVNENNYLNIKLAGDWKIKNIRRDRIGLIRLGSVTHAFNFDQRYIGLKILEDSVKPYLINPSPLFNENNQIFDIVFPNNPNLIPPGYYMLFIVSALSIPSGKTIPLMGTPSIAKIIKIEYKVNKNNGGRDEKS